MSDNPAAPGRFATTRWSVVLGAGGRISRVDARAALEELCQTYWPPLYAYLRRHGCSPAEAEDTVQGFFALLLERDDLAGVHPDRGRFRSFLLASLKHFLSNQRDRERAVKRGGGRRPIPLDVSSVERCYTHEPTETRTPEAVFDRSWALTLLQRVQTQLRDAYRDAGKAQRFDVLSPYLTGEPTSAYRDAAQRLEVSEGAVKVAVHRLRQDFREMLRSEIAQTVASAEEIEDEIRDLFEVLRRGG